MVITRTTRNRFAGDEPARGFESHRLRQKITATLIQVAVVLFICYNVLVIRFGGVQWALLIHINILKNCVAKC